MSVLIAFEQGLHHCDGNTAIYQAVLQQFLLQYQQGLAIEPLLNDTEQARIALHTLKGLAATIGAAKLSASAAQAYQQWSQLDRSTATQQLEKLQAELVLVLQSIERYLASPR